MKGSAARTPRSRPDAGASIRETAAGATVACAWGKADHACFRRKIKTGSLLHGGVPRRARMALDLSLLNPQQRKAVVQTEGPVLVLAGAGSGKTRVITHRVVHLLGQGVPGGAILAVTFTNKAAAEMQERVLALAGGAPEARRVSVSTFHAFGMKIIREQHQALGLPAKFAILDGGDQAALLKRLLRDLKIDDKRRHAGRTIDAWRRAGVRRSLQLDRKCPGWVEGCLEESCRSNGNILGAANAVIARSPGRKPKRLWTERGRGPNLRVVAAPTDDGEAKHVADEIIRFSYEEKIPLREIAVLYRTNAQARPFEEALRLAGVRYKVVGGTSLFDRKEVRDLVAYLRAALNPSDEVALLRIVNMYS